MRRHTLGLLKDALVNTSLQGLVEQRVEHLVRDVDGVVRLDILLELLTTMRGLACTQIENNQKNVSTE